MLVVHKVPPGPKVKLALRDRKVKLEPKVKLDLRDPKATKELPDHRDQLDLRDRLDPKGKLEVLV